MHKKSTQQATEYVHQFHMRTKILNQKEKRATKIYFKVRRRYHHCVL